jgi:membrane fusion protein
MPLTDQQESLPAERLGLFRKRAVSEAPRRLFGPVCVATPPATAGVLLLALLAVIMLAAVTYAVEVPERARAVGVLMPAGGLLRVVATDTGQVTDLAVAEGMAVREGQVLLRIASDRNAPGRSPVSESRIRSLRAEVELLQRVRMRQREMSVKRVAVLQEQIELTRGRLAQAQVEADLQAGNLGLLEQRFERLVVLAQRGSLATDVLLQERSGILRARALGAGLERDMLAIRQQLATLQGNRDDVLRTAGLEQLQNEIDRGRLSRQIAEAEIEAGRVVLAPADGVVARLTVTPGSTSRPGQILMTLYKAQARLEAWLYLPSDKAGQLRAGQPVQLRLDAYPRQIFGTLTAVVSQVSTIALLAADLTVPLPIRGPVFEVRASIDKASVEGLGTSWPLAPGTSFHADVIRRRYRLYQWLLRALWSNDPDAHAIAGA